MTMPMTQKSEKTRKLNSSEGKKMKKILLSILILQEISTYS